MGYGQAIKNARKAAKLTQAQLAEKCGLAQITIGQYERGLREPRREQLELIASALDISLLDLVAQEPAELEGFVRGVITPANIADELGISVELVWQAIRDPSSISSDLRKKIASAGTLITMENETPEVQMAKKSLQKISYCLFQLNEAGLEKAEERVSELTEIKKYRRD